MVVIPQTDIFLLKSPLQIDNKNQLTFTDATAQYNYFSSLPKLELDEASYQRKDGVLRFNGNFEDIIQYNYCMYKNENYSNKWFYSYIVGMEYKNDNCTYIYLKTDVFQCWQFDLIYKQSYVEREMINVNEDVPGANLQPENLETGEYKIQGTAELQSIAPAFVFAYSALSININGTDVDLMAQGIKNINGIPTTVVYLVATTLTGFATLAVNLFDMPGNQSEKVVAAFTVPQAAINGNVVSKGDGWGVLSRKRNTNNSKFNKYTFTA